MLIEKVCVALGQTSTRHGLELDALRSRRVSVQGGEPREDPNVRVSWISRVEMYDEEDLRSE